MTNQVRTLLLAVLSALAISGCAAKSHTRPSNGILVPKHPHTDPVCFIRTPLPSSIKFEVVGQIRGGKKWYGRFSEVLASMADEARSVGADAVIKFHSEMDVNVIAWARPIGEGTGIKLEDKTSFDCKEFDGVAY